MSQPTKNNKNIDQVNYDIRAREVLIIMDDGNKIGPLGHNEAIRFAEEKGFDLLLVSTVSDPPVAKLVDYGKYKYEQKKKEKENKKNQHVTENKEIRLRTGIGDHDLEFKAKKVREFLKDGNRVKISLKFRGREVARPEFGKKTLDNFFSRIEEFAKVKKEPQLNGLFLDMYVVPKK